MTDTEEDCFVADLSKFEKELKDCLVKQEVCMYMCRKKTVRLIKIIICMLNA